MPAVGLIILAAGCSSRLGSPKQLLKFGEKTLLARTIEAGLSSNCRETVVVLGSNYELIRSSIEEQDIRIVKNDNWQEGIASSIRSGVNALENNEEQFEAAIVATCDQPFLTADILNSLIESHKVERKPIAACEYLDTLGTPVLFEHSLFGELKSLIGSTGAKQIVMSNKDRVARVPFPDGAVDIDTQADFESMFCVLE